MAGIVACKFGDDGGDGGLQIQQAALVKNHRHGGGGDGFRDGGEIKDTVRGDGWGSGIVGETTEGVVGDEFSAQSDGQRAGRECADGNRVLQQDEGVAESLFLSAVVAHEEGEAGGRVLGRSQWASRWMTHGQVVV